MSAVGIANTPENFASLLDAVLRRIAELCGADTTMLRIIPANAVGRNDERGELRRRRRPAVHAALT